MTKMTKKNDENDENERKNEVLEIMPKTRKYHRWEIRKYCKKSKGGALLLMLKMALMQAEK